MRSEIVHAQTLTSPDAIRAIPAQRGLFVERGWIDRMHFRRTRFAHRGDPVA